MDDRSIPHRRLHTLGSRCTSSRRCTCRPVLHAGCHGPARDQDEPKFPESETCVGLPWSYALSIFTRKPLNSGVYAFGSIAAGDKLFAGVSPVRPLSSAMPR